MAKKKKAVVYAGKHVQMVSAGGWEYAHRPNATGIVGIVAVTDARELVLIEQYRPPLDAVVIEIPAGLAGDVAGSESESLAIAAKRELLEETGFSAKRMKELTVGCSSAGITDELITMFLATGLTRTGTGEGDGGEQITTHLVPLDKIEAWIKRQRRKGKQIDLKVYAALHFARGV